MVSGIEKEKQKIEKYFIKQLKSGISLDFYKDKFKQADELLAKKLIDQSKYDEVKRAYLKKKEMISVIDDCAKNVFDLASQKLFAADDEINKMYFESLLCYGDESLFLDYISMNSDLDKKIKLAKDKFVEELDKAAKSISLEKSKYPISGLTITNLADYKKVFKDGYDYINSFIEQELKIESNSYLNDDNLLYVRVAEKNTKLFKLYSYSFSDEIINIRALETISKRTGLRNKLTGLRYEYMKQAETNLRWLYLNKAVYCMKDNYIFDRLRNKIQERIIDIKCYLDNLSIDNTKLYEHFKVTKKLDKCDKEAIDMIRFNFTNSICKEIEKTVPAEDYEREDSYYYKYYQKINKQKKCLEQILGMIKIPKFVTNNKDYDEEFLKEKYIEFYVTNQTDECSEDKFNSYIEQIYKKGTKTDTRSKVVVDDSKYKDVAGYKEFYYEEPLKSFDNIVSNFNEFTSIKLTEKLRKKREFLFEQYENLIIRPNYKSTFYEFLKEYNDLVEEDLIVYERDIELFCSLLYKVYSEYNIRKSFVNYCTDKGLNYVPLQYTKPELFIIRKKTLREKYNDEDNDELEEMINEALISISENS